MATVNLGKIKLKWRGTYAGGTAYSPDDVVEYTDGSVTSTYICVTASTGNAPSSGGSVHSSWNYMAKGQATSPTTNQGDIIVRGASADGRLAIGSAGQVLKVNSSANGLEYGNGTGIQQVAYANKVDTQAIDYNAGRTVISGLNATLASAPASGNKIYVSGQMTVGFSGGDPGTSPRWEYSTDNSSWNTVYLSTYMAAGTHAGLDANSNWGVGAGFKSWNDTYTVMCCTLSVMVTANEISNARYFRVTVRQTDNSNDTIWINRPGGGNLGFAPAGTSSLVVMEVKA